MRGLAFLAVLVSACPVAAADLDCVKLKSTEIPFAVDYKMTRFRDGKEIAAPTNETLQVFRRGKETVTYHVFAPGKFARNRFVDPLFPLESAAANGTKVRRWNYSIDTGGDQFGRREPLEFSTEMHDPDGSLFLKAASTIKFEGIVSTRAQGCGFDVVRILRTNDGTIQGKATANRSELWLSPELRVTLFSRIIDGTFSSTYVVTAISTDFRPVE